MSHFFGLNVAVIHLAGRTQAKSPVFHFWSGPAWLLATAAPWQPITSFSNLTRTSDNSELPDPMITILLWDSHRCTTPFAAVCRSVPSVPWLTTWKTPFGSVFHRMGLRIIISTPTTLNKCTLSNPNAGDSVGFVGNTSPISWVYWLMNYELPF